MICSGGQVVMHLLFICFFSCYLGSLEHSSFVKDSVQPPLSTDPSLHHPVVTDHDIKRQITQTQHPTNFPSTNDDGTMYTDDWRTDWEKVHCTCKSVIFVTLLFNFLGLLESCTVLLRDTRILLLRWLKAVSLHF